MTATALLYRFRIAAYGADTIGNPADITLDLDDLLDPPIAYSPMLDPLDAVAESRPFQVNVLDDAGALTTAMVSSGRWQMVNRLCDVQFSDDAGSSWNSYGTGRINSIIQTGPRRYRIEAIDEAALCRHSHGSFGNADTTQLWPYGLRYPWRGFAAARAGQGTRIETVDTNLYRIKCTIIDAAQPFEYRVLDRAIRWVEEDMKEDTDLSSPAAGNFNDLRLNYDGTDYEVVTFGDLDSEDLLESLRAARFIVGVETFPLYCTVYSTSLPPASGDVFLHAPTAPPSEDLPLHIGVEDGSHRFGTADGWVNPVTLTKAIWDEHGISYDSTAMSALESDDDIPLVALDITAPPDDVEAWSAEHLWAPNMLIAVRNSEGKRKLVKARLPQDVDPTSLNTLDNTNARAGTWRLVGREMINKLTWKYKRYRYRPLTPLVYEGEYTGRDDPDMRIDGMIVEEITKTPDYGVSSDLEAGFVHEHEHEFSWYGATGFINLEGWFANLLKILWAGRGSLFDDVTRRMSKELLDIYQDGPVRGMIEVGRTTMESTGLEEGDLVVLDCGSLKIPNPATGDHTGSRLVRILGITTNPAYSDLEYLDLGPSQQPLASPTVVISQPTLGEIDVAISNIPAGATAIVEVVYTDSASTPSTWVQRRTIDNDGTLTFTGAPGEGWAHARAMSVAPNRIRSAWATDSFQLGTQPQVRDLRIEIDAAGTPTVYGTPNGVTAGLRLKWGFFGLDEADNFTSGPSDYDATDFATDGIELTGTTLTNGPLTVEVEPWTGFSGGSVTGTAGPAKRVSVGVAAGSRPQIFVTVTEVVASTVSGGTVDLDSDEYGLDTIVDPYKRYDIQVDVEDPSGLGGTLYIYTNPDGLASTLPPLDGSDPAGSGFDDSVVSTTTPVPFGTGDSDALAFVLSPMFRRKEMGFLWVSDSGRRDVHVLAIGDDRGDRKIAGEWLRQFLADEFGLDLTYGGGHRGMTLEEFEAEWLAGFLDERVLTPALIASTDGLTTLMDGEGRTIENLVIESTVTDDGARAINLFLAKSGGAGSPDDLDEVSDGGTFRKVVSIDANGRITAGSIKSGVVQATHLEVGIIIGSDAFFDGEVRAGAIVAATTFTAAGATFEGDVEIEAGSGNTVARIRTSGGAGQGAFQVLDGGSFGGELRAIGSNEVLVGGASSDVYIAEGGNGLQFFALSGAVGKQSVSGSTGGNAALQNLLTALANYNLITDNTT